MSELPTGTVTFLFTDIEGSTRLVQYRPESWPELLAQHCQVIRGAIADAGGVEVATEGDGFFAVFEDVTAAVRATASAQRNLAKQKWPSDAEVRVRMGLHTGEGTRGGDNYVGLDVHRAARIAAAANGGQIVISATTQAFLGENLPSGLAIRDLGAHRLKDLANPEHIYQLDVEGLPSDFPALRSLDAQPNNLPVQLTSFVGRDADLAAINQLLDSTRLITLTGPGGTGKTRLALEVAAGRLGFYGDGVFFVELAPITDPQMVPTALAAALRLRESADRPIAETIKDYLSSREILLVFDNFEQVLGAAPLVTELLSAAPRLRVIATSRAVLHLQGEREYAVPPLAVPDAAHLPTTEALSAYEGVALFIDRASSARADFAVTSENAPAIAEIVARLDGLPLAIELAAAKCRLLGPEAVLGRLGSRLAFLSGGARDLPARQRTLREAIDWSYDLLTPDEQGVMRQLAIFVGGFTLEAAETVTAELTGGGGQAFDTLAALVDQSLVRHEQGPAGEPRFAMLETIREYGLEQLGVASEVAEARRVHAEFFVALAERLEPSLTASAEAGDAVARDQDNFRSALGWAIETEQADLGLRLGFALWRFWQQRGQFREGRDWFEKLLALPAASATPTARARGLTGAGGIAYWQNDYPSALRYYEEAEALIRSMDDPVWLADAIYNTGTTAALVGDMAKVGAKLAEGTRIGRETGDDAILVRFLQAEGYMWFMGDDLERARPLLDEALNVAERDVRSASGAGGRTNDRPAGELAIAHHTVGQVARLQGRLADAAGHYRESLRIGTQLGELAGVTEPFQGLAAIAIATEDPDLAARGVRWLGAYTAMREQMGGGPPPEWLRLGDPLADARALLSTAEFEKAWDEGLATPAQKAFADALETASILMAREEVSTAVK